MGTPTNGQHEVSAEQAVPRSALERMPRAELFALARKRGILNTMVMTRDELLEAIATQQAEEAPRNGRPGPAELVERAGVHDGEPIVAELGPVARPETEAMAPFEPEPEPSSRVDTEPEAQARPEPEGQTEPEPEAEPKPPAQPEPEPAAMQTPERQLDLELDPAPAATTPPPRPTAAPLRSPEPKTGIPMPGVAAAAVATAVFLWRRRR